MGDLGDFTGASETAALGDLRGAFETEDLGDLRGAFETEDLGDLRGALESELLATFAGPMETELLGDRLCIGSGDNALLLGLVLGNVLPAGVDALLLAVVVVRLSERPREVTASEYFLVFPDLAALEVLVIGTFPTVAPSSTALSGSEFTGVNPRAPPIPSPRGGGRIEDGGSDIDTDWGGWVPRVDGDRPPSGLGARAATLTSMVGAEEDWERTLIPPCMFHSLGDASASPLLIHAPG